MKVRGMEREETLSDLVAVEISFKVEKGKSGRGPTT